MGRSHRWGRASALALAFFGTVFLGQSGFLGRAAADEASPPPKKRTIGVVAPLSGTAHSWGETVKNSVLLASKQFDSAHAVTFLFEDDQLQPKNTVTAVNKLILEDKVDGLIVYGSPTSLAVNSLAEQAKVPMIALSIVDRVVEGKKYVMKHWVPARTENDLISAEVRRHGYKRVAIVTAQNDAMLLLRNLFRESAAAEVVLDEEFPRENTDFRATVARIRSAAPDAVYVLLWSPQPGTFAKQLREQGYTGPIFGSHNLEDANEVKAAGGALEGAWLATGDDRNAIDYLSAYKSAYQSSPTAGGVDGFDVAAMFIAVSQSPDLNAALHGLKGFRGGFGVYGATEHNDFNIPAVLKQVTGESFRTLGADG